MDTEDFEKKILSTEEKEQGIPCYFTQIKDLASSINIKEINTDTSKYKFESKQNKEPKTVNCTCFKTDNGIKVITEGGSQFNLPFEQKIENIFPLAEGLLIEFHIKHELKLQDLLTMSRFSKEKDEYIDLNANEDSFYSYVTINRHPLNPLKILGGFIRKNSEKVFRWYRLQEKICHIDTKLPLVVSYNYGFQRHAFHYVRINADEKNKEDNTIQFQNNFYTLYNLHNNHSENSELLTHSTLITDMFFEETTKENIVSKCEIIKGNSLSEVYIFMLLHDNTSYVKLYSVDFMNQNYDNPIATKCVRKVSVLNDVCDMFTFNLFENHHTYPKVLNVKKKMFKSLFDKIPCLNKLVKSVNNLSDTIILYHSEKTFSLYYGSQCFFTYDVNLPSNFQALIDKQESFPLFTTIPESVDGKMKLLFENGTSFKCSVAPKINNFLISLILKTLAYFFDDKLYDRLFLDIVLNCQSFEYDEDKKFLNLDHPQNESEEFDKFVFYIIFLLKLCSKNGLSTTEDVVISNDEKPSKKVKSSNDEELNLDSENEKKLFETLSSKKGTTEGLDTTSNKGWNQLCKSKFHITNYKNMDQLFKKKIPVRSSLLSSPSLNLMSDNFSSPEKKDYSTLELPLPKVTVPLDLFYHNRVKIFRILHLLYQELKLNKLYQNKLSDMAYLLFCFARNLNHDLGMVYCDYYVRENLGVLERYKSDASLKRMDEMIQIRHTLNTSPHKHKDSKTPGPIYSLTDQSSILEKDPPDIFKWIQNKLSFYNKPNQKSTGTDPNSGLVMPIAFKMSHQICKIFEILTEQQTKVQPEGIKPTLRVLTNKENILDNRSTQMDTENVSEKKNAKKTSIISDIFAKTISPSVSTITNDFETAIKFELDFPFFHYSNLEDNSSSEEKVNFNYKTLKNLTRNKEEKIFLYLIKKNIGLSVINQLNYGISTPIFEILRSLRQDIPPILYQHLPKLAYKLIKRDDLYRNLRIYWSEKENLSLKGTNTLHGLSNTINNLIRGTSKMPIESLIFASTTQDKSKFATDHAFCEATRLLETMKPMRIKQKYLENIPEDKIDDENKAILFKMCIRRFSVLLGQGALNFATLPTMITEALKIPKINLSAISPLTNTKITLEFKDEKEQALLNWPEFHNGVGNGLKLFQEIMQYDKNQLRTWIFYQRPETPKYEHGGFLLAMGLLGFLDSFMPTDIYQYLKPGHEATSVGILLGLASSRIGKMDEHTSKTLCLHIPYLLPPSYDIEIPLNVQTAALVGIGLLHMGTSNRIMTEMTLAQIGRKPLSDKCLDRDGYSLAAGFALGLINLCKGTSNPAIKDLDLDERLIRFVEGGKPMDPPKSMLSSNYNYDFNKCSSVREGNFVNTHITCPAALVALALVYLKSNKQDVVNRILIPNSFSGIEFCNPNHILMKIVTRNLIMWDKISNTTDYIYEQIPSLIRFIFERPIKEVYDKYSLVYNIDEIDFNTVSLIYCNIIGGCIMSMGLRYAGTGDQKALETIIKEIEKLRKMKITKCELANDISNKNSIDNYSLSTLLCISVLAMSLIMAGTCDITCLKWCRVIRKRIEETSNWHFGFNMAVNMAIGFLFLGQGSHSFTRSNLSIAALLISIYPHFPTSSSDNKYHLQALRHFYVLAAERRMFYTVDVETNKVVNLRIRLEIEDGGIGEPRIENQQTPVLIQESKKCISIRVLDDEYYNIEIKFKNKTLPRQKILYVRKRYPKEVDLQIFKKFEHDETKINEEALKELEASLGNDVQLKLSKFLSSSSEPLTKQQLLTIFPFNEKKKGNLTSKQEIKYVQSHYNLLSTLHKQLNNALSKGNKNYVNDKNLVEIYLQLLREDRVDLYPLYLGLMHFKNTSSQIDAIFLQNFNVISKFYGNKPLLSTLNGIESKVFNTIELEKVRSYFHEALNKENESVKSGLLKTYLEKLDINTALNLTDKDYDKAAKLMKFLIFTNFPSIYDLGMIKTCIYKFKSMKNEGSMNKSQEQTKQNQEEKTKKVMTMCELYLYMSFPLCPKDVLNQIACYYFE